VRDATLPAPLLAQTSSSDCSAGSAVDWQDGPSKRITRSAAIRLCTSAHSRLIREDGALLAFVAIAALYGLR
jgi:hypothetical protein